MVDLKKKTTSLSKLKEFKPDNYTGNYVGSYFDGYYKPNVLKQKKDFVLISKYKPNVKIPVSLLYEEPIKLAEIKDDYEMLGFRICFTRNTNQIICSPCMEIEMGDHLGNIYLIDSNGKYLKTLIKNKVVDFNLSFRKLDYGNYLFGDNYLASGRSDLYLFDNDFNLLQSFNKVQHFEALKQDK